MAKYDVLVKPGSSQEKVVETGANLTVFMHARAHDGEANKELVRLLAKYFGVAKGRVEIVAGLKARRKVVEIK